jgi:hypothetical protein
MSKQIRLVIIAAVLVAALGTAALFLLQPDTSGDPLTFKDAAPTDVRSVVINNASGTFNIQAQDQGYTTDDISPDLLDMEEFVSMMTYAGAVNAMQMVDGSPSDLSKYGLDAPAATIDIAYNDNSSLSLSIGNAEPISGNYYFTVAGKPAVYLMEAGRCASFLQPKKDYIDDMITPVSQLSSPLSAVQDVTFIGGPLAEPVSIKAVTGDDKELSRIASSFGAPTHLVMGKGTYELDQTYGVDLLGSLLGITATDIVGYGYSAQQIADFGFSRPNMTVEFDVKTGMDTDAVHYKLTMLEKDNVFYMTCNDNGVIYQVDKPLFYTIQYDKLPVHWFLSPLVIDVQGVDLTVAGQTYTFDITGKSNSDKQVTCNGQPLDIDRFRTFYQLLISAASDGMLIDQAQPEGEPLLTLTYRYVDEKKAPDVMKLYKGPTRRVYVEVNGAMEFSMAEAYLTRVQEAAAVIMTDKVFETDW